MLIIAVGSRLYAALFFDFCLNLFAPLREQSDDVVATLLMRVKNAKFILGRLNWESILPFVWLGLVDFCQVQGKVPESARIHACAVVDSGADHCT